MSIYLTLLHQIFKSFLLQKCFLFFLLPLFQLLVNFFSLSFRISNLTISSSPELYHIFGQTASTHHTFFCKSLRTYCPLTYFFKTILTQFAIIIVLISFSFLIHSVSFRDIFLNDVLPCTFEVCLFLLKFRITRS